VADCTTTLKPKTDPETKKQPPTQSAGCCCVRAVFANNTLYKKQISPQKQWTMSQVLLANLSLTNLQSKLKPDHKKQPLKQPAG
jgi:hypothetical protein